MGAAASVPPATLLQCEEAEVNARCVLRRAELALHAALRAQESLSTDDFVGKRVCPLLSSAIRELESSKAEALQMRRQATVAREAAQAAKDRLDAQEFFTSKTGSTMSVSGWDDPCVQLAKGRRGVDDAYLCPSGLGKWTRPDSDSPYVWSF